MIRVDEHARDAGEPFERAQVGVRPTCDDIDRIHPGVRDVQTASAWPLERIGVVEALARPTGQGDRTDAPKRHAFVLVRQYA